MHSVQYGDMRRLAKWATSSPIGFVEFDIAVPL